MLPSAAPLLLTFLFLLQVVAYVMFQWYLVLLSVTLLLMSFQLLVFPTFFWYSAVAVMLRL
jgi:hypothetical protein